MKMTEKLNSKNIIFQNRVIMPPMATGKADERGHVSDQIIDYYEDKTKSGLFAAVIVEHNYVNPLGQAGPHQMYVGDDSCIEGLSRLAGTIRTNGSKAILQISHSGSAAKKAIIGDIPVGPSPVLHPRSDEGIIPRELTVSEIKKIRDDFVRAAIRAAEAGFDGVEIHSAHGYLLDQFLSPITNKRADMYGGTIENRVRLHMEISQGIRKAIGDYYPVFIRMGAGDFMDGGLTEEDAIKAARLFEKTGYDVIDVSGGMCFYTIDDKRPGYFDVISKPIYDNVDIPVILTGGVKKGRDIEDILARNVCDLVGVGRSLFADSDWPEKELGKYFD